MVPRRTSAAFVFALAVAVAGGLVAACYGGLVGPALAAPRLSTRPYLDPSWPGAAGGGVLAALEGPLAAAILLALGAGALVLLCDAVIRRAFLAEKPAAAALAAAILLLAPGWGNVLRLEGHGSILAGFVLAPAGLLLVLEGGAAAAWAGGALAALAAALHPAWAGGLIAAVACAAHVRRRNVALALGAAALVLPLLAFFAPDVPARLGWADRLRFAAQDLAAAPVLAFSPWRRLDVPTGYEPLVTTAPVVLGLAVHALVFGAGMMIGGIARGLVMLAAAAAGIFAAAFLVPGWVPGDRAFAIPAMAACAPLLALVLAVAPRPVARSVAPGLVLGAAAIAVLVAWDRAPAWTRLGAALSIPGVREFAREPDLARLVLYLHDVTLRDADAVVVVGAADRLVEARSPALFPERLEAILGGLTLRTGHPKRTPDLDRLLSEVTEDLSLVRRLWAQNPRANFEPAAAALVAAHTKVLDLFFRWKTEADAMRAVIEFQRLAREIIPVANRAGYPGYSIPLLEALQLIGPENPGTAATIAIQRMLYGEVEQSREDATKALERLPAKSPDAALVRGIAGMAALALGDPKQALRDLQASWSVLGAGGAKNVAMTVAADTVDYFVLAEILLARFEAAKAVDPALAAQAARDLEDLLKPPLSFGTRRTPALAIMGRLQHMLGNRDRALALLREARKIPAATLDDRSDGPIGRIAHPRYRRMALEALLLALGDGADTAAERDEVEAELLQIRAG
jgi:hypothetical protein